MKKGCKLYDTQFKTTIKTPRNLQPKNIEKILNNLSIFIQITI
jgi:hypothetical protein